MLNKMELVSRQAETLHAFFFPEDLLDLWDGLGQSRISKT